MISMLLIGLSMATGPAPPAATPDAIEKAVLTSINAVRRAPDSFLPELARYRSSFEGKVAVSPDGADAELTQEGSPAVDEALAYLRSISPRSPLTWDEGLARMAREHAEDQKVTGVVGHEASDGSDFDDRLQRAVGPRAVVWEIISYGETRDIDVVRQFIVDDGEHDRGHRSGLFDAGVDRVGVACRAHPVYAVSCVVELSSR